MIGTNLFAKYALERKMIIPRINPIMVISFTTILCKSFKFELKYSEKNIGPKINAAYSSLRESA